MVPFTLPTFLTRPSSGLFPDNRTYWVLTSKQTPLYAINHANSAVCPLKLASSSCLLYLLMKNRWNIKSRLNGPKYVNVVNIRQYCRFWNTVVKE